MSSSNLHKVDTKSMSVFQNFIYSQLKKWFPDIEIKVNYRPYWMIGLELDFYIPSLSLAIEVNGAQHYSKINKFHKYTGDFHNQVVRDYIKEVLLIDQDIKYIVLKQNKQALRELRDNLNSRFSKNFNLCGRNCGGFYKHIDSLPKNVELDFEISITKNSEFLLNYYLDYKQYDKAVELMKKELFVNIK